MSNSFLEMIKKLPFELMGMTSFPWNFKELFKFIHDLPLKDLCSECCFIFFESSREQNHIMQNLFVSAFSLLVLANNHNNLIYHSTVFFDQFLRLKLRRLPKTAQFLVWQECFGVWTPKIKIKWYKNASFSFQKLFIDFVKLIPE